ncbi:MAG: ABC transporter ATP-binding protein [Bryobacteraceae bacterium]
MNPLLTAELTVAYPGRAPVLDGAQFEVREGEVLGLIGASGSGKSTIALAILGLLGFKGARATGSVCFRGRELLDLRERDLRRIRGREIGLVLQSAQSALNPALRIESQLAEAWTAHAITPWKEARDEVRSRFESIGLPADDAFLRRYPSQISVGQAQRVLIAMAVLHRPALVIADEPTSALDAVTQQEVLALFGDLNQKQGTSVLFISHDLVSVASFCHRVAILAGGKVVEAGSTAAIFEAPQHEYTRKLVGGTGLVRLREALESHPAPVQTIPEPR